ncbi:hypothetical protein Tco_0137783 [Tanacetum coccineum]
MAQQVIPAAQLVLRFHTIKRCNNYAVLQNIPCSPKSKIVGQILLDHPLGYALTATVDVPVVYLQQFWRTISKVHGPKNTIKFMLNTQEFIYTVDMFCDILYLPVEILDNPFVAPVNIETIKVFMNKVGYQGVVDKTKINIIQLFHAVINQTNVDYAALLCWDFMNNVRQNKEAIQYPRFIKLILADLMKKFLEIPQSIKEDYHSINDDILLVSVYTIRDVRVRGMLIPDEFLTEETRATDDFKESTPSAHRTPTITASPQGKRKQSAGESSSPLKSLKITIRQQKVVEREKDEDDSKDRLEPESHKDKPENIDDDDEKYIEKVDEEEGGETGSLETRTEEMQTPIPTTLRSPRTILSSDKNISQELTETVPLPTITTSNTSHSK